MAACPHVHRYSCELHRRGDGKAVPLQFSFRPRNRNPQKEPPSWTLPAAPGPPSRARRLRGVLRDGGGAAGDSRAAGHGGDGDRGRLDGSGRDHRPRLRSRLSLPEVRQDRDAGQERPRTAPRDVFIGDRQILLCWRKTRWHCDGPGCEQGTFTEALPAVRARARLTARLRARLGEAVGDDLMPAAAAARRYGVSDRTGRTCSRSQSRCGSRLRGTR